MTTLSAPQWICAALGALLVGISKTGISGLSALAVALFTYSFASGKQASGLVLPLLIFADVVAVSAYRRHAQWRYLLRLFPPTACGVVLGAFALGRISDHGTKVLVGALILSLAGLSVWRRRSPKAGTEPLPMSWAGAWVVGIVAGFVTLVANAAGPLMATYLVSMRLPKLQYAGTTAVFFLLLNLFKVPFMSALGLITWHSLELNGVLLPAVLAGTFLGRWLLLRLEQRAFENLVLTLSALADALLLL